MQPFHVTQIDPNGEDDLALRVTGYKFHFSSAETVTEDGMELLPMTFQIISIESTPVHPPEVTINLLKDANGRLMIASFRSKDAVEGGLLEEEDCKQWPLVCEWKSIVADRIEKLKSMGKGKGKGCHKGHEGLDGEHHSPMQEETLEGKPPHRFRPGRPHPHHRPHHGHHQHGHQVQMFFRRAIFTILHPLAVGIFAGTLTYLVGMALGCLIAIAIAKVRGQEYQRVALEEDVEEGERSMLSFQLTKRLRFTRMLRSLWNLRSSRSMDRSRWLGPKHHKLNTVWSLGHGGRMLYSTVLHGRLV